MKKYENTCKFCNNKFETSYTMSAYCSPECRRKKEAAYIYAKRKKEQLPKRELIGN